MFSLSFTLFTSTCWAKSFVSQVELQHLRAHKKKTVYVAKLLAGKSLTVRCHFSFIFSTM